MVRTEHCCEDSAQVRHATLHAPYHFTDSGLPNVYLAGIRYFVCKECGKEAAEIPAAEGLMKVIARTIVEREAQLTGAEIRFLRKRLHKKAAEFARIVGVSPEQVSRWENEYNLPEESTDKFIRVYYGLESGDSQLCDRITNRSHSLSDWLKTIPELDHINRICAVLDSKREWKAQAAAVGK
jgi:putative zinc finger/helix-turn-helix YgiT family protein